MPKRSSHVDVEIRGDSLLRLHAEKAPQPLIDRAIMGDLTAVKQLQSTYLGFIVVKPLPSTVIGRTCLVTYSQTDYGGNREDAKSLIEEWLEQINQQEKSS